ncbi:MAG: hypothetical protein ACOYXU_15120 [Nitrospirota bacterium]
MRMGKRSAGPGWGWYVSAMGALILVTVGSAGIRALAAEPSVSAPSPAPVSPDTQQTKSAGSIVFRAPASTLPNTAEVVKGKAPDEVVEIVLPGRLYTPPLKLEPVATRSEANRSTPEQASASDFSAFRAADGEWLKENFSTADYPSIKRLVEDRNIRKQNQSIFMRHGSKAVVATSMYRDHALVFVQYDGAKAGGLIEVYTKVGDAWKRTNELAKDPTVAVLLPMFRNGSVE